MRITEHEPGAVVYGLSQIMYAYQIIIERAVQQSKPVKVKSIGR